MSEVLYRKWRPRTMEQVVGQERIMQTLRHAVATSRIAHAYLFCGPRGTGKTSTARILAKAVNCLSPIDGEPDNACRICVSINEGRALDLIEIDAASNRGIDDIRELSDKIQFTPNEARYKVYIIDEVHMLTEQAFNALLKTLEEPPGHAMFVLATTEVHKVPLTIISRCQRFDFRRIPLDRMIDKLAEICNAEGVEASEGALALMARASNGGLRDAENLLEQATVSYGSPLDEEQVRDMLGMGGDQDALDLVAHIAERSVKDGLTLINEIASQGSDLRLLHRSVVEFLRALLLIKARTGTSLGYPEDVVARLNAIAEAATLEHIVHALKAFSSAEVRRDNASALPLELAIVEAASTPQPAPVQPPPQPQPARQAQPAPPSQRAPYTEPPRPAQAQPERPTPRPDTPAPARPEPQPAAQQPAPQTQRAEQDYAPPQSDGQPDQRLKTAARELRHVGKRYKVGALMNVCKESEVEDGKLVLKFSHVSNMERMREELEDPQTRRTVAEAISKIMGADYEIRVGLVNESNGSRSGRASASSHLVSAAMKMGARIIEEKEELPR